MPRLRDALATTASLENADQDLLPNLGIAAQHLGDDALSLRFHDLLLARARSTGAVVMILYALTRRCFSLIATGKWGAAHADASEALELARGTDQPGLTGLPLAWLTLLAALRGEDSVPSLAGEVDEVAATYPARPWAQRAAQELRASGETARKRDPSTVTELTAQETQVARLVAHGMSNRDVAAQLFLSPRTIDFHLRNVFAKLGVTSRAELARLPLD